MGRLDGESIFVQVVIAFRREVNFFLLHQISFMTNTIHLNLVIAKIFTMRFGELV